MANDKEAAWTQVRINQSVEELRKYGPSLRVAISPVPDPTRTIHSLAQIDTGAHGTALNPRICRELGLTPFGEFVINEAGRAPIVGDRYRVRLFLPPAIDIEMDIAAMPSLHPPHEVLIGRDVLSGGRMMVDFTTGVTVLQFKPSRP